MFGLFGWMEEKERDEKITIAEWITITGFSMFLDRVDNGSIVLRIPRKFYEYWKRVVSEPIMARYVCNENVNEENVVININASWESLIDKKLVNIEVAHTVKQQILNEIKKEILEKRKFEDVSSEELFKIVFNALYDAQAVAYAYYLTLGFEQLGDKLGVAIDALREIEDRFWKYHNRDYVGMSQE